MGIELVIFIAAILFGIFLYWRESNGNGAYRFLNKIVNSKELQMKANNPKGFVYKQSLLPRLIFVVSLVLVAALIIEFLTPIAVFSSYNGISAFASFAVGTLIGTYLASFIIKSSEVIEEQSVSLEDKFDDVVEKGKDFLEDLKNKDNKAVEEAKKEIENEPEAKMNEKSARERLKDKGLM
ncbi:YqkE family protein [Winogradskyella sp. F6397]|uniref:YqkE family protein n=1 Tax=Winogradskyella marina TaxID=2785530 RepID=A0ABS0EKL5_9FLAO|nr:YqkE family protein [Winogradskyella marina]MBF8149970.1 YqkE family protein [Winogradskyella marina]